MKRLLPGLLTFILLIPIAVKAEPPPALPVTCTPNAALRDIRFQVKGVGEKPSPYIDLGALQKSLAGLLNPDAIVLPCREVVVVIDYPLKDEFEFPLKASTEAGFSRAELVRQIGELYQRIYREEAESASVSVVPPEERKRMLNRNKTDGKYGIWGHDLRDLGLHTVSPEIRNGTVYLTLGIDS